MLRKTLLAALAAATLAGCATGYSYRGGAGGDYYYGQPRTEYRYYDDSFGFYGSYGFGRYAPAYYYDRYGRLVYGGSYGYYGYPYGYGSQWWYRPRPHGNGHGGGDHDNGHGDHDADRDDRRPPWRNIGGVYPRGERVAPAGDDQQQLRKVGNESQCNFTGFTLAVAHQQFSSINLQEWCRGNAVVYDVKGFLPTGVADARL